MTIVYWIFSIWFLTVIISWPFIKIAAKRQDAQDYFPFNVFYLAKIIAFVPVVNIVEAVKSFIQWRKEKKVVRILKRVAKSIKDPETSEKLNHIADQFNEGLKL